MPLTLGDEIANQGWACGAVFAPAGVQAIIQYLVRPSAAQPVSVNAGDWLVIASQTCDVLAKKLEAEPFVEVLHCKPIEKLRAGYKELRSTRFLDFKPNRETHEAVVLSAHAVADRYLVPREVLKDHTPDNGRKLSKTAVARLLAWYTLRSGRPAWPDRFVGRIGKVTMDILEKALEPLKDDIAEVRVAIVERDEELLPDQDYHVVVYFIVDESVWDQDIKGRAAIQAAFAEFTSALGNCNGIQVDEDLSGVVSGAEFSWQDTRTTDEWNFANLSNRG